MTTQRYFEEIKTYQKTLDQQLRAPDGWLTLAGLHWLQPGSNSIGSATSSTVCLPPKQNYLPTQIRAGERYRQTDEHK